MRITKDHNAGKIGLIIETRKVQYVPAGPWSSSYLVLYHGLASPYPYTEDELEVISE